MNLYIYESLTDIEIRLMELLSDIKILREQSYYSYESTDEDIADQLDKERLEAFEALVKEANK